jgi:hypothetical protein
MATQITLTLPEDVLERAEWLARRSGRPVADLLAETIELSLRPLGGSANGGAVSSSWSDEAVLAAVDAGLAPEEDRRLSELLDRQQGGRLSGGEHAELTALMQAYSQGLVRKAQALREAVRRGLREPLAP